MMLDVYVVGTGVERSWPAESDDRQGADVGGR
jgi:hypothetical protein